MQVVLGISIYHKEPAQRKQDQSHRSSQILRKQGCKATSCAPSPCSNLSQAARQKSSSKESMQDNKTRHGSRRLTKCWRRTQAAARQKASSPRTDAGRQDTSWLMTPGDQHWRPQALGHGEIIAISSTISITPASSGEIVSTVLHEVGCVDR